MNLNKTIGAHLSLENGDKQLHQLFSAFADLPGENTLYLALKRDTVFSLHINSLLTYYNIQEKVSYYPYYEKCDNFPIKKKDCDLWIEQNDVKSIQTAALLKQSIKKQNRNILFFTSFHPLKHEGNSCLMKLWLDALQSFGYKIHLVYYMSDIATVSDQMREETKSLYDLYVEIPIQNKLTGKNHDGSNTHVDDWCGQEALTEIKELVDQYDYDYAVVNYVFMSAIFQCIPAYTEKILLTHDIFTNRNKKLITQGYPTSGWASVDQQGEKLGCLRSDVIVALQNEDAEYFTQLVGGKRPVMSIGPVVTPQKSTSSQNYTRKHTGLKIGCFGSQNWVNEYNISEYIKWWATHDELLQNSSIHIAGGVCENLVEFLSPELKEHAKPKLHGRFTDLSDFFEQCDVIINPERGGTGIKIKTLESLAHHMPIISTNAGMIGLETNNKFHQARDIIHLAELTKEIVQDLKLLHNLQNESISIYKQHEEENRNKLWFLFHSQQQSAKEDYEPSCVAPITIHEDKSRQEQSEPTARIIHDLERRLVNSTLSAKKALDLCNKYEGKYSTLENALQKEQEKNAKLRNQQWPDQYKQIGKKHVIISLNKDWFLYKILRKLKSYKDKICTFK